MKRKKTDTLPQITALYERISREDDAQGDSCSIVNQRKLLEGFSMTHGFQNLVHYSDDGYSGVSFDRPAWKHMMEDVESGRIKTIITKDMSRIGRNYLEIGRYTELVFPHYGVRFIAVESGVDSDNEESKEFTPILNLVNEYYVKDHSEKVRASYHARSCAGKHTASCPLYGYRKDPKQPGMWLVDEEAAEVVRHIFQLAAEGMTTSRIATILYEEKLEKPSLHLAKLYPNRKWSGNPYHWSSRTIQSYLANREYMGMTVNFKTNKPSYKSKEMVFNPEEKWEMIEGTHEAIISPELWHRVQEVQEAVTKSISETRTPTIKVENRTPLEGYVVCADCGEPMLNQRSRSYPRKNRKGEPTGGRTKPLDIFYCKTYVNSLRKQNRECARHTVHTEALTELVLESLRGIANDAMSNESKFLSRLETANIRKKQGESVKNLKKQVQEMRKRHAELDDLIQGAYEANFKGMLTDERLATLTAKYEAEQEQLEQELPVMENQLKEWENSLSDGKAFLKLVRRYADFSELTPEIVEAFLEKIVVHDRIGDRKEYTQEVEIYFNFIGKVELMGGEK